MSADAVHVPEPATRSGKDDKKSKDHKVKKRKREEEQHQPQLQDTAEPALKKSKKRKQQKHTEAGPDDHPVEKQPASENRPQGLNKGLLESNSPFVQQTASFYLALSPCAHNFPLEGVSAEHISPLLLTYYPPLKSIVLSFTNPRLSEHPEDRPQANNSNEAKVVLAKSIDEYAVTYVWLTAEFVLFRPKKGTYLEGYINLQNESILGLVCYNYFNAGIERERLPKDWRWVSGDVQSVGGQTAELDGDGYYVDGDGERVEGRLIFRVEDFDNAPGAESGGGTIHISGTLLLKESQSGANGESSRAVIK